MAGPLRNGKHERFAQEVAKGSSYAEAYRTAGYKPDRGNAVRLTTNDSVRSRIAELQGRTAARTEITVEGLIEKFDTIATDASKRKQYAAACTALTAISKLAGLWIDKRESLNVNRNVSDPVTMTDAEIIERLAAIRAEREQRDAVPGEEDPDVVRIGPWKRSAP